MVGYPVGSVIVPKGRKGRAWAIVRGEEFDQICNMFDDDFAVVLSDATPKHPALDNNEACHTGLWVKILFNGVAGYVSICDIRTVETPL